MEFDLRQLNRRESDHTLICEGMIVCASAQEERTMTMTHSRTGPRTTHRAPPATKPARSKPAKGGLRRGTVNDPKAEFSGDEWHEMVSTAAYFRAESRGFEGGSPEDDWYEAEAELREQLSRAEETPDWTESPDTTDEDVERSGE
jgi:hypothetical protein